MLLFLVVFCGWLSMGDSCKEEICGPIVSKCMLTQSCKCDFKNSTCSRDCFYCLDYLYTDCCSCVEMCPKPNGSESRLSQKSHVEELEVSTPDLFNLLTEEKDYHLRWVSFTYPIRLGFVNAEGTPEEEEDKGNCTVAFMSQCTSWNKCKQSCLSMQASSYRWFHDGCCQCVGSTCINYGMNQSRCLECPRDKSDFPDEGNIDPIKDNDLKEEYNKNI